MERVLRACASYREAIDEAGAERVVAMLTSAVRDAANGAELERELRGASASRPRRSPASARRGSPSWARRARGSTRPRCWCSTSAAAAPRSWSAQGDSVEFFVSTQIGSVRIPSATCTPTRRRRPSSTPAARRCAPSSRRRCRARCASGRPRASRSPARRPRSRRSTWRSSPTTATAWTATGSRSRLRADPRGAGALPLAERRVVRGLHPDRAPTIVAGGIILVEAMRLFGLDEIEVSEHDILDGAALEAARNSRKRAFRHFRRTTWIKRPVWGFAVAGVLGPSIMRTREMGPQFRVLVPNIGSGAAATLRRLPLLEPLRPPKARTPARPDGASEEATGGFRSPLRFSA